MSIRCLLGLHELNPCPREPRVSPLYLGRTEHQLSQNRAPIEPELSLSAKSAPELWFHWAISGPSLFGLFWPLSAVGWVGDERLLCALGQWGQPEDRGKVVISRGHHQPRSSPAEVRSAKPRKCGKLGASISRTEEHRRGT